MLDHHQSNTVVYKEYLISTEKLIHNKYAEFPCEFVINSQKWGLKKHMFFNKNLLSFFFF